MKRAGDPGSDYKDADELGERPSGQAARPS